MEIYLLTFSLIVLLIAVLLLFLRRSGGPNIAERETLRRQKEDLVIQLARAEQQVESLAAEKGRLADELRNTREQLLMVERSRENLRAYQHSQQEKLQEQKAEIEAIKRQLNTEFQVIANK